MIVRAYVFIMPVFHAESFWNHPKLDKSQSFIQVSCMDIGRNHRIKLQNFKVMSCSLFQTVQHKFFPDI